MSGKSHDNLLTSTAKAIGTTAGKIASLTGVAGEVPAPAQKHSAKKAHLAKKNKHRLPRRMKKAQKKAGAQAQSQA